MPPARSGGDGAAAGALHLRFRVRRASGLRPDRPTLRRLCQAILISEGVADPASLGISFVDDDEMARINGRSRGVDRSTDVLSFPLDVPAGGGRASTAGERFTVPPGSVRELGDIVVSGPRAVQQAIEYGHELEREVGYLVAHGLLHILGYDHEEEAERAEMRAREEAALATVGLTR
jgi:probable rRNA maturation factor